MHLVQAVAVTFSVQAPSAVLFVTPSAAVWRVGSFFLQAVVLLYLPFYRGQGRFPFFILPRERRLSHPLPTAMPRYIFEIDLCVCSGWLLSSCLAAWVAKHGAELRAFPCTITVYGTRRWTTPATLPSWAQISFLFLHARRQWPLWLLPAVRCLRLRHAHLRWALFPPCASTRTLLLAGGG